MCGLSAQPAGCMMRRVSTAEHLQQQVDGLSSSRAVPVGCAPSCLAVVVEAQLWKLRLAYLAVAHVLTARIGLETCHAAVCLRGCHLCAAIRTRHLRVQQIQTCLRVCSLKQTACRLPLLLCRPAGTKSRNLLQADLSTTASMSTRV